MYYKERQVAQSLGCTWVLGNPGILRKGGGGGGGGGRVLHVSQSWDLYLGTRESQDIQTRGWGYRCLNPGMYILGY